MNIGTELDMCSDGPLWSSGSVMPLNLITPPPRILAAAFGRGTAPLLDDPDALGVVSEVEGGVLQTAVPPEAPLQKVAITEPLGMVAVSCPSSGGRASSRSAGRSPGGIRDIVNPRTNLRDLFMTRFD